MNNNQLKVILAMEPGEERDRLASELEEQEYPVKICETGNDLWNHVNTHREPQALILDTDVSGADTEELLEAINAAKLPVCALLLTDENTANMAAVWASLGAWSYLLKPLNWGLLTLNFERIRAYFDSLAESASLRACLSSVGCPRGAAFSSPAMSRIQEKLSHAARGSSPVLIHGEHGIDKKAVAFEIHARGPRKKNAFIAIESSLFLPGDPQPSASPEDKLMRLATGAHQGTLFIDEVSSLPLAAQCAIVELLKQAPEPDPGSDPEPETAHEFRLIAATSVNLALEVGRGAFLDELFNLLNHRVISIPPLRERAEDIPDIARRILRNISLNPAQPKELSDAAMDILSHYYWPGNERELRNVIERAAAHAQSRTLQPEDILALLSFAPPEIIEQPKEGDFHFPSLALPLCDIEKEYIARVLHNNEYHRERTASSLGISRKTLYLKMKEYKISRAPGEHQTEPED